MDACFDRFCRDIKLKGAIILSGNISDISQSIVESKYNYIVDNIINILKNESSFQNIIKWDRIDGIDLTKFQRYNLKEQNNTQTNQKDDYIDPA